MVDKPQVRIDFALRPFVSLNLADMKLPKRRRKADHCIESESVVRTLLRAATVNVRHMAGDGLTPVHLAARERFFATPLRLFRETCATEDAI